MIVCFSFLVFRSEVRPACASWKYKVHINTACPLLLKITASFFSNITHSVTTLQMNDCENNKVIECTMQTDVPHDGRVRKVHLDSSITPRWPYGWVRWFKHINTRCTWTLTHTHTDFRYMHTLRGEMVSTCAVNQPPELPEHEGGRLESREKRFVAFSANCLHKNIFIRNIGEYSARESITFPEVTYNFCYSFTLTVVKTLFKQYYWKHHQRISHKKEK